ncbi:hypothetical protein MES5069_520138 [Mesorhizobium escarrei]|uniref:Uncharacterized protein n=1 Tax=Mesorhizobium escarrei TaxID=666018 RepID=A0ABM9ECC5_9HYPH|nr:hypothetical protein MES5069_520138 [Mesorhizobium escarrei]
MKPKAVWPIAIGFIFSSDNRDPPMIVNCCRFKNKPIRKMTQSRLIATEKCSSDISRKVLDNSKADNTPLTKKKPNTIPFPGFISIPKITTFSTRRREYNSTNIMNGYRNKYLCPFPDPEKKNETTTIDVIIARENIDPKFPSGKNLLTKPPNA